MDNRIQALKRARDLVESGELDEGVRIAEVYLKVDPNDIVALCVLTSALIRAEKLPVAYHLAKRLVELAPKHASSYINLGMVANELWLNSEAERAYHRGLRVSADERTQKILLINLCALMVDTGRFKEAEKYARQVLEIDPDNVKAKSNLGFAQLANREWEEGWKNYRYCLGSSWRQVNRYNDEPEWDGSPAGS